MNKKALFSVATAVISMLFVASSCEDENKYESKIPTFDYVSVSSSVAAPGDTIKGTLYFAYEGSFIKGTYIWNVSNSDYGQIAAGEFATGAVKKQSFSIPISETAEAGTYKLTLKPRMMAAYAGTSPYLEYSSMGEVTTTLTIITNDQTEE